MSRSGGRGRGRAHPLAILGPGTALASGSAITRSFHARPLGAVQDAVLAMIPQLDERDQIAVVTYGNRARLLAPLTTMDAAGGDALAAIVRGLATEESTNMEVGMEVAYDVLADATGGADVEKRLMLFTDARADPRRQQLPQEARRRAAPGVKGGPRTAAKRPCPAVPTITRPSA